MLSTPEESFVLQELVENTQPNFPKVWTYQGVPVQLEKKYRFCHKAQTFEFKLTDEGISDGYHTFSELYAHRCILFIALANCHKELCWKSRKHHDGEEWDGWFIAGMTLPTGEDITYHLPITQWSMLQVEELDLGKEWDGHTSRDVENYLSEWMASEWLQSS